MRHALIRTKAWLARKEQALVSGGSCCRAYSALFVPCALLVLAALPLSGRELIWNIDGLGQYYPFFVYEGKWLRGIVAGLFGGQGLDVPLWEWCMGYGADVPTTFDVFFDPLNLVSAITPEFLSEWVFQLLVVVRLYLAGLAFAYYCRMRGENKTGTVAGALLYALCGAGLTGVRWSSGLHALMLFPVILAGAERILARKRPWVFVASLSLLAIVSYYFTYMACFLLVGYLALRVVMIERPHLTVAKFLRWVGIFGGLTLLCLVIAGFAIVPSFVALTGMDRLVDQTTEVPLLYGVGYYLGFATSFFSTFEVGSDTLQGFGGLALLACILLVTRDGHRELKLTLAILTVFLFFPLVGSFFNGLNYATNRWTWAYDLCMALVLVRMTPHLLSLDDATKRMLAMALASSALLFLIPACRTEANVAGFSAALVAFTALCLWGKSAPRVALVAALSVTLAINGFYQLAADEGGNGTMQTPLGMAYKKLTTNSYISPALDVPDEEWWRFDTGQLSDGAVDRTPNDSLVLGLQSSDFYNSVYNGGVDAFHTEHGIVGDDINFRYLSLQGRSDLLALLGMRYYVYRNDGSDSLPYGFSKDHMVAQRDIMGTNFQVYEADRHLPLGFAYDKSLKRSDYLGLAPVQRQQALLQAVVLDDAAERDQGAPTVEPKSLLFEDEPLPFEVTGATGVTVRDGAFEAAVDGASVTFAVKGPTKAESYVFFDGLEYEPVLPSYFISQEEKDAMLWHYRANMLLQDLTYTKPTSYVIRANGDATPLSAFLTNSQPSHHMYGGKDMWLMDLGYSDQPLANVTLTFSSRGIYRFKSFQILSQRHEHTASWMDDRMATPLENVVQDTNRLAGTIDLDRDQTLLLTVARSAGWTATVDQKPARILVADSGFMALDLEAGHHSIELRYETPGLALGFAVSGCGLVTLAILYLVLRRRDNLARQDHTGDQP